MIKNKVYLQRLIDPEILSIRTRGKRSDSRDKALIFLSSATFPEEIPNPLPHRRLILRRMRI